MLIRAVEVGDAEALADLHLDVWDEAYGGLITAEMLQRRRDDRAGVVARWQESTTSPAGQTLLAQADDGRLIGFISAGPGRDDPRSGLPDLEVWALYVRAEVYGHGVGHALLSEAIGAADAYLWVLDGSHRAIAFYERQGFRFDGCEKREAVGVERRMARSCV